jgi:hypothetical protein
MHQADGNGQLYQLVKNRVNYPIAYIFLFSIMIFGNAELYFFHYFLITGGSEFYQRLNGLTQQIASGNIGENVRNEIQLRNEWKKLLEEAVAFYQKNPYFDLVYRTVPRQGDIDFNKNTVSISFQYWFEPNARIDAVYRILKAYSETKRTNNWNISEDNNLMSDYWNLRVEAELFAEDRTSLGKAVRYTTLSGTGSYYNDLYWGYLGWIEVGLVRTLNFDANADKISDRLSLKFHRIMANTFDYYGKKKGNIDGDVRVSDIKVLGILFTLSSNGNKTTQQ